MIEKANDRIGKKMKILVITLQFAQIAPRKLHCLLMDVTKLDVLIGSLHSISIHLLFILRSSHRSFSCQNTEEIKCFIVYCIYYLFCVKRPIIITVTRMHSFNIFPEELFMYCADVEENAGNGYPFIRAPLTRASS